jgi:hypothetical protein
MMNLSIGGGLDSIGNDIANDIVDGVSSAEQAMENGANAIAGAASDGVKAVETAYEYGTNPIEHIIEKAGEAALEPVTGNETSVPVS